MTEWDDRPNQSTTSRGPFRMSKPKVPLEPRIIDAASWLLVAAAIALVMRWIGWLSWEAVGIGLAWAGTTRWYAYRDGYRQAKKDGV